ncbi:IS630 family transposase [Xylanimonas ulmi]|nr:IS630 family transposase [Xylanibacterium ulmi]
MRLSTTVGRLLRRLGLSPQRPPRRSWKASPEAQEAWKTTIYPAIAADAKAKGAEIYFGDEASIRADHHAGTTWAPVGKTPVVGAGGDRCSVNMISAVTARGTLRFKVIDGTMDSAKLTEFCEQLLADAARPVVLIVDGRRIHKSKAVQAWTATTGGKFTIYTLPAHCPHLDPDEWVWQNVKPARIGRVAATSKDNLRPMAIGAPHRLRKLPAVVGAFFADPDLAYITTAARPA